MRNIPVLFFFLVCLLGLPIQKAEAHTSSESFLTLTIERQTIQGNWAIALRDLEYSVGLDQNGDGSITWSELQQKQKEIERFALSGLTIAVPGERCSLSVTDLQVEKKSDGAYASLFLGGSCLKPIPQGVPITIEYRLFFDANPQHRGLMQIRVLPGDPRVFVFSPENRNLVFSREKESTGPSTLQQFVVEGVWHIWTGYDHILFLLALLFPAVLVRRENRWEPSENFSGALIAVLKVVTAFTVAHSITLALAAMQLVHLSSRFVESTIALSVFLAAMNNIVHAVEERRLWWVAFLFGLIHGFGFAGVMSEFGLQGGLLLKSILAFNLGVEAGQMAIVVVFLPIAFFLRRGRFYLWVVLRGGSLATAFLAWQWMIQRMFGD